MTFDLALTTRCATVDDLAAILQLVSSCADAPRWAEPVWRTFTTAGSTAGSTAGASRLLLLSSDNHGQLCGLLAATYLVGQTELESVLVAPSTRRRGVGLALTTAWLHWAEAAGDSTALLEVRVSNTAALALYASLGFVLQGRRVCYYREPDEDALLMGRRIGSL